jgi:hypothetical protein
MVAAGWACWYMHIIPALRRLRQRIKTDFEISLRYIVRPCLKKKKKVVCQAPVAHACNPSYLGG